MLEPVHLEGRGREGRKRGREEDINDGKDICTCIQLPPSLPPLFPLSLFHSLNMDVRVDRGDKNIGDKVILHTRVHLDNVPSLAPHVQVVDGSSFKILWPATDGKSVAPVCVCVCVCVCVQGITD